MSEVINIRALLERAADTLREDPELRRKLADAFGGAAASPAERYESPAEYAARLGIGVSTVRIAIREGRLESIRVGRAVRIPVSAVIRRRIELEERDDATARAARVLGLSSGKRA